MLCWLSITLASLSWLFAFHHYVSEQPIIRWALIGAALVTGILGCRVNLERVTFGPRYLALFVPLAATLLLVSAPHRPPFLIAGPGWDSWLPQGTHGACPA